MRADSTARSTIPAASVMRQGCRRYRRQQSLPSYHPPLPRRLPPTERSRCSEWSRSDEPDLPPTGPAARPRQPSGSGTSLSTTGFQASAGDAESLDWIAGGGAPRQPRLLGSCAASIRVRAIEKPLEEVEHFRRLVMLKPVARALDLYQFGVLEMRHHAGRLGIGQKTLAAADQER